MYEVNENLISSREWVLLVSGDFYRSFALPFLYALIWTWMNQILCSTRKWNKSAALVVSASQVSHHEALVK